MSIDELNKEIGENIKNIREFNGESQLDLAIAIDASGSSTISNYETRVRKPDMKFLKGIADHYCIPIDLLLDDGVFSNLKVRKTTMTYDENYQLMIKTFPIVKSNEALSEIAFKCGFLAHTRIYAAIKHQKEIDEKDLDEMFDAYETSNRPEAAANELSYFLCIGANIKTPEKTINDILKNGEIDLLKARKDMLNYDFSDEDESFFDGIDEIINDLIVDMKRTPLLLDLSNYYLALKYVYNVTQCKNKYNQIIGMNMIEAFADTGNKYAKKYLSMIRSI